MNTEIQTRDGSPSGAATGSPSSGIDSDSIVASCDCLTKTNEVKYHKPGCKYRLIFERDEARGIAEQAVAGIDKLCAHIRPELPETPLPWNSSENAKEHSTSTADGGSNSKTN